MHIHIYTYEIILHTYQCIYVWDNDHAPTQIYPSYTHIFVVQLSSSHVTMSHIMTMLPKLPLRKCPLHSKFLGSLQSSHSVSWNCRSTQYFGHHKITWSNQGWGFLSWGTIVHPLNEINFRHANCNSLSNSNLTEMQFQAMVHCSVNEIFYWFKAFLRFRSQSPLNFGHNQIMPYTRYIYSQ